MNTEELHAPRPIPRDRIEELRRIIWKRQPVEAERKQNVRPYVSRVAGVTLQPCSADDMRRLKRETR